MKARLGCFAVLLAAVSATNAEALRAAPPAAAITVRGTGGKTVQPLGSGRGKKATVLVFVTRDCPISNGYAPEIIRLYHAFTPRGVRFYLVYVEPGIAGADALSHVRAYGYPFAGLLDSRRQLVRQAGATVTPEVSVHTPDGRQVYRGRINDRYPALGVRREQVTRHDLRDALTALLAGHPPTPARTRAIGCFIP